MRFNVYKCICHSSKTGGTTISIKRDHHWCLQRAIDKTGYQSNLAIGLAIKNAASTLGLHGKGVLTWLVYSAANPRYRLANSVPVKSALSAWMRHASLWLGNATFRMGPLVHMANSPDSRALLFLLHGLSRTHDVASKTPFAHDLFVGACRAGNVDMMRLACRMCPIPRYVLNDGMLAAAFRSPTITSRPDALLCRRSLRYANKLGADCFEQCIHSLAGTVLETGAWDALPMLRRWIEARGQLLVISPPTRAKLDLAIHASGLNLSHNSTRDLEDRASSIAEKEMNLRDLEGKITMLRDDILIRRRDLAEKIEWIRRQ